MTEVLIVLVISAVVFAFIIRFSTINTRRIGVEGMKGRLEARVQVTMNRLRGDIRNLGLDPLGVGIASPYILIANAQTFSFKGDFNGDNALEVITYRVNGSNLERSASDIESGAYQPLSDHVQSLTFRYYNIYGNVTAVLGNIRKIQMNASFQSEGMDETSNPIDWQLLNVFESFVPRNLIL